LRVRTVRRNPIDADALARAMLEHAAMNAQDDTLTSPLQKNPQRTPKGTQRSRDSRHDHLA
jgi:hypothetical protein